MAREEEKRLIGERLREARKKAGYTQEELAKLINFNSKSDVSKIENGKRDIPKSKFDLLAEILKVSPIYLLGYDSVKEPKQPSNLVPMSAFKRGVLAGDIACGDPINCEEGEEVLLPFNADLALYCIGDSMVNAGINDGDIVYIKRMDWFDEMINGKIAAVGIGDDFEYTLKRWFYNEQKHILKLVPENDDYKPKIFQGPELEQIHLLGVAVGYTSVL